MFLVVLMFVSNSNSILYVYLISFHACTRITNISILIHSEQKKKRLLTLLEYNLMKINRENNCYICI